MYLHTLCLPLSPKAVQQAQPSSQNCQKNFNKTWGIEMLSAKKLRSVG